MNKLIDMENNEKTGYQRVKVTLDGFRLEFQLDFTNNRLRVLEYELEPGRGKELFDFLAGEARRAKLGKVIIYAHPEDMNGFKNAGFCLEGSIPGYYGGHDAWCFAIFISAGRQVCKEAEQADRVLAQIPASEPVSAPITEVAGFELYPARRDQAAELAHLYASVFSSYPTPVDDSQYIQKVMEQNAIFYVASYHGEIVSAASADINWKYLNAEMTDCATLPVYRQRGLMVTMLSTLEEHLRSEGLLCLYTLARAVSPGMNKAFWRLGYSYTGRLINNCHIAGDFEDMNIWTKYNDRNQE